MDVFFAILLVILTTRLSETTTIKQSFKSIRHAFQENINTAKLAIKNVFSNKKLKLFLIYRSFSHHILFFGIILLPVLSEKGMDDWISGLIKAVFIAGTMFASKYVYKI